MKCLNAKKSCFLILGAILVSCSSAGPTPGPDKQFEGQLSGAVSGAGAGAVTGFQVGAGTGPGAAVGAGLGAIVGAIKGANRDSVEDISLKTAQEIEKQKSIARVHEILEEQYKRRIELHPTREIYPADLFFFADRVELCPQGMDLIAEISKININRMPWSRIVLAVYAKAKGPSTPYAEHLVEERASEIAKRMAIAGIDPRRIEVRPMVLDAPVLVDPLDRADRYSQAIEFILVDR